MWKTLFLGIFCLALAAQIVPSQKQEHFWLPPLPKPEVAKILGQSHLLSDILFIKTAILFSDAHRLNEKSWQWMLDAMCLAHHLDVHYFEIYFFTANVLPWQLGARHKIETTLKSGLKYLPNHWEIPFYLAFYYLYFVRDKVEAAKYLSLAAHHHKAPHYLPLLTARIYAEARHHGPAILFLKSLLRETQDERIKKRIEKRLEALQVLSFLEGRIQIFKRQSGQLPKDLKQLIDAGLLKEIPKDPYGGRFFLKPDGTVWTTSNLR